MMETLQKEKVSMGVSVCVLGWVLFCFTVATSGCKWIWSHDWIKKWVEHSADQRLCEDVGDILQCTDVAKCQCALSDVLADEMVLSVDVLGARMFAVIRCDCHCRLVIGV